MKKDKSFLDNLSKKIGRSKGLSRRDVNLIVCALLARKVFFEYITASGVIKGVEPEHFVEDWIIKNVRKSTEFWKKMVWRYFLFNLMEYRNRERDRGGM